MVLKKLKTVFCAGLVVSSFVGLFVYQYALCAEAVNVRDGLLSVNLKDTSLLEVARDIEKQSGVWFRGDETLFQEKISVSFNDLPFEEGLKRILTNLNYSLMFDTKNKVAGVVVMGEGKPAGTQPARPGAQPPRVAPPPGTPTRPVPTVRSQAFNFHSACCNCASTAKDSTPATWFRCTGIRNPGCLQSPGERSDTRWASGV